MSKNTRVFTAIATATCLAATLWSPALTAQAATTTPTTSGSEATTPAPVELVEMQKGQVYLKIQSTPGADYLIENGDDDGAPEYGELNASGTATVWVAIDDDRLNTLHVTFTGASGAQTSTDFDVDPTRFDFYAPDINVSSAHDASSATVRVTGESDSLVRVRDASGSVVAGGVLTSGRTSLTFAVPRKAVSYSITLTRPSTGEVSPARGFLVNPNLEGSSAPTPAPTITSVVSDGHGHAAATITGTPGGAVSVRNGDGAVVGIKIVGAKGTAVVPVALDDDDTTLSVSQKVDGSVSSDTTSVFTSPPKVQVGRVTPNNAIVTFEGPRGTTSTLKVKNAAGETVKSTLLPSSGPAALVFAAPAGSHETYTAERDFGDFHTTARFTIDGGGQALAKPTVRLTTGGGGANLVVHGVPYASVTVSQKNGPEIVKSLNAQGDYTRVGVASGTTFTVTQSVKSDFSLPVTVTVP